MSAQNNVDANLYAEALIQQRNSAANAAASLQAMLEGERIEHKKEIESLKAQLAEAKKPAPRKRTRNAPKK